MTKYIDAEKLKAFKEALADIIVSSQGLCTYDACKERSEQETPVLLGIINSLQQEQPDFPTTDEQVKEFLATHPKIEVPEKYKNPDWLFKKQERSEVNFKIEERKWVHDAVDNIFPEDGDFMSEVDFRKILKDTAHHFYELGLKAKEENK